MNKIINYGLRTFFTIFLLFSILIISELNNIKEVEALSPETKVSISNPKLGKVWNLDQAKVKVYITTNSRFPDQAKINNIVSITEDCAFQSESITCLYFDYDGIGINMIYDVNANDNLI